MRDRCGVPAILLLICAGAIAACGSGSTGHEALSATASPARSASASAVPSRSAGATEPTGAASQSARATAAPSSAPLSAPTETVTDQVNGQTIDLRQGQVLHVVLSSTYWTIHGSSNGAVLSQVSGPSTQPQPSGCVPGQGCGTVTADYRAVAAGHSQVSASRGVCGEALGCTSTNSQFVVYVIVE